MTEKQLFMNAGSEDADLIVKFGEKSQIRFTLRSKEKFEIQSEEDEKIQFMNAVQDGSEVVIKKVDS